MKILKTLVFIFILISKMACYGQLTVLATAYAQIVPLIGVTETQQLSFGQFSPLANGGSVTISPQGSRTINGSIIVTETPVHQGSFTVSGTQDNKLNVILPTTPVYIYHQNGVNYMYLDNWKIDLPNGGTTVTGKEYLVNIGSTLHVAPIEANPIGLYMGSYPVIFFYN